MLLSMTGPIRSTWEKRDLPLLESIARAEGQDNSRRPLNSLDPGLREASGLDEREFQLGLQALYDAGYIAGNARDFGGEFHLIGIRLLERGRRTVGQWPPEDQYDAFVAVLEQQIAAAGSDDERSRLERVREVALGVGRDVLTSVLSAWARQLGGL